MGEGQDMVRTGTSRLALVAACALLLGGCVWGSYRFGPDRTGSNPDEHTLGVANVAGLHPAWSVNAPATSPSSLAVYANLGYVASGRYLRAINVVNGATVWTVDEGLDANSQPMIAAPPVVTADGVWSGATGYQVGCAKGGIFRYDRNSGAVLSRLTGIIFNCDPGALPPLHGTASAGTDYLPYRWFVNDGSLHEDIQGLAAVDPATHSGFMTTSIAGDPTVGGGRVYMSDGAAVGAFDGVTGCGAVPDAGYPVCNPAWRYTVNSSRSLAYTPGALFAAGTDGKLDALDPNGCTTPPCSPMWIGDTGNSAPSGFLSAPAVAGGVVYVGSSDGNLYAFPAAGCGSSTCSPLWSVATGGVVGDPTVANGVVYFGSADGKVYAAAAAGCGNATCNALWSSAAGASVDGEPVVSVATVYVSRGDGTITAYRP